MRAASDVAGDANVVGLVGQDEARRAIADEQAPQNFRVGRAAADDAMRAELKNVARASDGDCIRLWRERPLLEDVSRLAEDDLVDLVGREAGDLDRRVGQDQLLKLDLELFEIPLPFLSQAIDRKAQDTLLVFAEMIDAHAREPAKAEQPRRLDPDRPVDNYVVLADNHGNAKAKPADRVGDLTDMSSVELTNRAPGQAQVLKSQVVEQKSRQRIVSHSAWLGACRDDPRHPLTAVTALGPELISERAL